LAWLNSPAAWWAAGRPRLPWSWRFSAMTVGHVILGVNRAELESCRVHEHVHVRQYELWGIFFLPAYALSGAWQRACGRDAYRDNFFERQAYAVAARTVCPCADPVKSKH